MIRRVDTWAGALCLAIGLGVLWEANRYSIGSLGEMGPGFYPAVLGGLLALVGALIALSRGQAPEADPLHSVPEGADWRGWLCIVAGVAFFVTAAERLGMVTGTFGCVFIAALGDRTATLRGSLVLAAAVSAFGALLFRALLGVNLPLWPTLFQP